MSEIVSEKIKTATITPKAVDGMLEMIRYLMDAYGNFAEKLGTIQRDHKGAFDVMMSPTSMMQLPARLNKLSEKNPELSNLLAKLVLQMSIFLPQIANLINLTAEEKIKLGVSLKSISKDIDTLLDLTKVKV